MPRTATEMRKHKMLLVTPELLVDFLMCYKEQDDQRAVRVDQNPLPKDTVVVEIVKAPKRFPNTVGVIIASEKFERVPPKEQPPILDPPPTVKLEPTIGSRYRQ